MRIAMRGLEYMNDDPSEVDVLYAQIQMLDGSEKLQVSSPTRQISLPDEKMKKLHNF